MIQFPKRYADLVARLRVPSGFLIVLVFALFSRPTPQSLMVGLPIAVLGLALRAWAAGSLAKNRQLATGGPYAHVRNPLYVGTLIVALGLVVASRSAGLGILFAAVFLLVYLPVIQLEEQHLRSLFPDFAAYAAEVPALIPRLTPAEKEDRKNPNPFRWRQYLINKEYQAGVGLAAGMLYLAWKTLG
jgi:protein-S-isoprenylcysteine O-methyltransferase Ste14